MDKSLRGCFFFETQCIVFGWPALFTSGFSGNLAFESNKYLLFLLLDLMKML